MSDLPDEAVTAAGKAVRAAMRGSYTAEILATDALTAAAPALYAQAAKAERERADNEIADARYEGRVSTS